MKFHQIFNTIGILLVLASSSFAFEEGPYVGGYGGLNVLTKSTAKDDVGSFNLSFKPAAVWGVVLGWELGPDTPLGGQGKIELEYSRRSNGLDQAEFADGTFSGSGELRADSILLNTYYVHRTGSWLSPYAGLGAGVALLKADRFNAAGLTIATGTDTAFAYQAGVGLDIALVKHLTMDLGYRFMGTTRPTFTEPDGVKFKSDYYSHNALLGLRVGF